MKRLEWCIAQDDIKSAFVHKCQQHPLPNINSDEDTDFKHLQLLAMLAEAMPAELMTKCCQPPADALQQLLQAARGAVVATSSCKPVQCLQNLLVLPQCVH